MQESHRMIHRPLGSMRHPADSHDIPQLEWQGTLVADSDRALPTAMVAVKSAPCGDVHYLLPQLSSGA